MKNAALAPSETPNAQPAQRAALYLRVSTPRQADHDLSIPDQRRQLEGYCLSNGWEVAAEFVEPGVTGTDDRRPAFQEMMDAAIERTDHILAGARRCAYLVTPWTSSPSST